MAAVDGISELALPANWSRSVRSQFKGVEEYVRDPQGRKRRWCADLSRENETQYLLCIRSYTGRPVVLAFGGVLEQSFVWRFTTSAGAIQFAEAWLTWRRSPSTWRDPNGVKNEPNYLAYGGLADGATS